MSKNKLRTTTKQPGIYKNTKTGKYDVKYNYSLLNPQTGKKEYKAKWVYGINSYTEAKKELDKLKERDKKELARHITLQQSLELWLSKASANSYSEISIRNTKQQFSMITKFWTPDLFLSDITEEIYLDLIAKCREYGYSEETIWNINACLRKLINIAYKNRYLKENPMDFWDSPRINPKNKRQVIPYEDYEKIDHYFSENEFWRLGENHYPKYRFLICLLYYTGMRIGEALALRWDDFEEYQIIDKPEERRMRVHITKSYNSAYKLLKGTKNDKTRKIPLPLQVIEQYCEVKSHAVAHDVTMDSKIFTWDHGACNVMIKKACREKGVYEYNCHDFRHTYISTLVREGVPIPIIEKVSGDTQATIFKRYSHMFPGDEELVLQVLEV